MAKDPLDVLRQQAQEALSRGLYQEARQIYQQALGYRSDSPEIHYGIATVCFLLGDLHSAVYHFKEVIRLDPARPGAYINLGAVYNRLEQYDNALLALRRGIKLDPNRAEGYYNIGLVYRQLEELDLAVEAYDEAVRLNPRMYDAHFNLGNIYFECGHLPEAIVHYQLALEIRPDWEKALKALHTAQSQQGDDPDSDLDPTQTIVTSLIDAKIDPKRTIDPVFHGQLLRDLHDITIDLDTRCHTMLEFLQLEVDKAIRELSMGILTPHDPRFNLEEQIRHFDTIVTRLQALQEAVQSRVARGRLPGEQVLKY